MVLECNYSLNCNPESAKHNFADLEEFPALTKSKPISFGGATWKKQIVLPSEDFIESESTGNDLFTVSKKKRLKKKKKPTVCCEESTDDSSPIKYSDRCFFVRDEVKFFSTSQPLLHESHSQFPKSQSISGAILINSDGHLSESPIVEATNSLQAEDEGFAEDLVDRTTNCYLPCFSLPTSASSIQSSDPTYQSLQIKPIYESRRINSLLPSYTTTDQMTLLGSNQSASNSYPVNKERLLTSVRQINSEQHARSMSPSNLIDIYLSSKDVNDLGDEDDMEGTDLLHLISNSLDRFNAIVHPLDNNISALTSGLGESRSILSESYSSSRYSQDCLFPSDVVTKPMTILSSDKEYKLSNVNIDSKPAISKHFDHSSLLSLNSELGQISGRPLETNNSSCVSSCSSFGHLPLSLSYSFSNEVSVASCQSNSKNATYYPNIASTIPINVTAPSVVGYSIPPPTGSIRVNNSLVDKSKSCWLTLPNRIQHNTKVLTPSVEPNNLLVDLINNNRNMLTDSDIEMLNYLNLDLRNPFRNVPTTATIPACTTSIIGGPSFHQHVSNIINNTVNRCSNNNSNWSAVTTNIDNKCKAVNLSVNDNESLWNQNKSFQSKMLLMNKTQLLRVPMLQSQATTVSSLPLLSTIAAPSTPLDITKYECSNNNSDKIRSSASNKIIFNTRCMNVPYSKHINDNGFVTSYSLPLADSSKEWSTEASSSLPFVTRNSILAHSVGYHLNTPVSTVGPVVTTTTSCSITRPLPIINMNYPLTTENSTTNCVPTIGPSPTASSKNKVPFGGLSLPVCTNSTVKSGNGLYEGFRNTHCRRHNNIPSNTNVNSVCSMATLNSSIPICPTANSYTQLSTTKLLPRHLNSQATQVLAATITTDSISSSSSSLYPGTELVNGKPVIAKWRRACSFYLRGHCKKEDCEFAHDLTKVTCKFWEMGECFKGATCPFLHGYPPELNIEQSNNK